MKKKLPPLPAILYFLLALLIIGVVSAKLEIKESANIISVALGMFVLALKGKHA